MPNSRLNIRNFSIVAHIDHGKSTLADRFLELTASVEKRKMRSQFLDMMDLEREKGITIKLQPVRMEKDGYILNLIDTPGHVDFTYEVSRSLAAVEGAILLVDASQGVQAQTLANLHLAQKQGLIIIPVVNKIDLAHAQIEETIEEISQLLQVRPEEIIRISAKQGLGIEKVLEAVIEKVPAPENKPEAPLRALIFDSVYDSYKGIIAYVRIVDGKVRTGEKIKMMASGANVEVLETGVFKPQLVKKEILSSGEIGYLATGLKQVNECRVGDTITSLSQSASRSLSGYREPQPVVFASLYPIELSGSEKSDDYDLLKDGLAKLKLNDASLYYEPESSDGLGRGFRCGFLGMLHLEIVLERLKREYSLNLMVSSPSVNYQLITQDNITLAVSSASDWPEINLIKQIKEPWVDLEVIAPINYVGQIMKLLKNTRGEYQATDYLTSQRVLIKYQAPLNEIIVDFYDKLKNATSGYASMNYRVSDHRIGDLVRLDVLIAGQKEMAFSRIVHRDRVNVEGRTLVEKLKATIPPQLFAVALQAVVAGKIIARETISALRKDVTGYLYGGDYTRKKKLLEKQKKGKRRMKERGQVNIPQEVFLKVLRK